MNIATPGDPGGSPDHNPERSTGSPDSDQIAFVELDLDQCRSVLSAGSIGRVGWASRSGQLILPITYVYLGESIGFRTSPYGALSELIRPTPVAFEVDNLDPRHGTADSVLIQGVARAADASDWNPPAWSRAVVPWAGGNRKLLVEIKIKTITGRSIRRKPSG